MRKRAIVIASVAACAVTPATSQLDEATTVCGAGPTVKGIDVSYYQGTIDWTKVAGDGVAFAFVRVSDGTGFVDPNFATYWAGSRAAGIVHGAYQFFRPEVDPIAQADLLLSKIGGALQPDDLPPVIDVEVADNLGSSAVAAAVQAWVAHVAAAIGRAPIIYTGKYFWDGNVGAANMTGSPLWHAQYTSASCPDIATPWTDWRVWQYTSTGTVAGVSGGMDVNRWNGDLASLHAFLGAGAPCGTIDATGEVRSMDACFLAGGPTTGLRKVTDAGEGGSMYWTHTTSLAAEENFATWNLVLANAGTYEVEVSTPAKYAQSKHAAYVVHTATGDTTVTIDQTAVDGWQSLGQFAFAQGGEQSFMSATTPASRARATCSSCSMRSGSPRSDPVPALDPVPVPAPAPVPAPIPVPAWCTTVAAPRARGPAWGSSRSHSSSGGAGAVVDDCHLPCALATHARARACRTARLRAGTRRDHAARVDILDDVKAVIERELDHGAPTIGVVARALATSPRTLQRRLGDDGTSFRAAVEAVRADLARGYLRDPGLDLGDVATRLGYAEVSAFLRAFKRWTGTTPSQFRTNAD